MTFSWSTEMIVLAFVLAVVIGFVGGWHARRLIKPRAKIEDRLAGLKRFQESKAWRSG